LFINASVRRFAKTAAADFPQEGGTEGVQADIGFLMDCKAKRITLVQAKKLKLLKEPQRWDGGFHFKGKEATQLRRLIQLSRHAHYLFFISPTLGFSSLMLPAVTVRDSCESNANAIDLAIVRNGGMPPPDFILYGIIGLWTGSVSSHYRHQGSASAAQPLWFLIEVWPHKSGAETWNHCAIRSSSGRFSSVQTRAKGRRLSEPSSLQAAEHPAPLVLRFLS
jgi:hypothetical protein